MQIRHDTSIEANVAIQPQLTLQELINFLTELKLNAEMNPGTESTPGSHLRITGYNALEQKAFGEALKAFEIDTESKTKDQMYLLIIRPNPDLLSLPLTQLKDSYEKRLIEIKINALLQQLQTTIKTLNLDVIYETQGSHITITGNQKCELTALGTALMKHEVNTEFKNKKDGRTILTVWRYPEDQYIQQL